MLRNNKKFNYLVIFIILAFSIITSSAQKSEGYYKVINKNINPKPISPLIYGNFIELGFGRQIDGMWSEKLFNASFEEIIPYKNSMWNYLRKSPEENLSLRPWWHSAYEENQWYSVDGDGKSIQITYRKYSGFFHGLRAVLLNNVKGKTKLFLAQDGIWIKKGINCIFTGYLMNNRTGSENLLTDKVTIGIYHFKDFTKPVIEEVIYIQEGTYKEYTVDLNVDNYEGNATFAISIEPGASISCDGFSLMPSDNIEGWRKDVIEALKKIYVPIIRYPGGCFASFYNWRMGIGPRAYRIPFNSEYWGGLEENNVGTVEFVKMCRMIGSEPLICINMLTGTPADAADWVAYCNSKSGDRMGSLRVKHGHPEPLSVKYWELDNETYRKFGYEEYAKRCVEFSKAMKSVDPGIQLVMIGYHSFNNHLKEMLEIAGPYIDLITDRSVNEMVLNKDLEIITAYNKTHGINIRLCNTEWWAPFPENRIVVYQDDTPTISGHQTKIQWNYAMNVASTLLLFQRLGGDFEFANFNNLCNTWGQNIIESPKDTVIISAAGKIFEFMSRSEAAWVLKTDTLNSTKGVIVQATTTSGKDRLILYLMNFNNKLSAIKLDISAFNVV